MVPRVVIEYPKSMKSNPPCVPFYEGNQEAGEITLENKVFGENKPAVWLFVPELNNWFDLTADPIKLKIADVEVPGIASYAFRLEDVASAGFYVIHPKHNELKRYSIADGYDEAVRMRTIHFLAVDASLPGRTDFLYYSKLIEKNSDAMMYFGVVSSHGLLYVNVLDSSAKLFKRYNDALNNHMLGQIINQSADERKSKRNTVEEAINYLNKSLEDIAVFAYKPAGNMIEAPNAAFSPAFGRN